MCGTSLPRPLSGERELSRHDARVGVPSQTESEIRGTGAPQNGSPLNGDASRDEFSSRENRRPATFDFTESPIPPSRAPISDETERGQWFETRTSESDRETNPWNLRTASSDTTAPPVSGPSFLGLADEPRQSVSYLLEEDDSHGGRRLAVVVLLLLVIGGGSFLAWHWKRTGNLYVWPTNGQSAANGSASPNLSTSGSEVAPSTAQDERAAMMEQNQDKNALRSSNTQPPTVGGDKTPTNGPPPVQNAQTVQNDDSANTTADTKQESANQESAKTSASTKPAVPPAPGATQPSKEPASPPAAEAASASKKPASEDSAQKIAKASLRQPAPPPANDAQDIKQKEKQDPLFVQGQRYLYGTGVRQNCDLAQKSLMTAAENANTQAQSTLATMYATGHCVPRSLPLAYRWFAKASHQEPNNPRITQDLEILWKQMTPEEKQIAIKSR
jgi:hypothetical protein